MAEEDRRAGVACRPAVAPSDNREQHVGELEPFLGKPVLVPWRSLGVATLFDDALRNEPLEALGEHLARDPEAALDLVEALRAPADVPDDERRPRLSGDVQGACDGAGQVADSGSLH